MQTWYAVARNEYRLMTSRLRRMRKVLPIILVALPALVFAFVIYFSNQIHLTILLENAVKNYLKNVYGYVGEFSVTLGGVQVDITILMSQLLGLFGFIMPIMASVGNVFRETEIISKDIILASPLRSRNILFGRFIANLFFLPLLFLFICVMFFFIFIEHGLNSLATPFIIALAASLPALVGIWLGVIISSYIQTKSDVSPRIKDIGKAVMGVVGAFFGLSIFIFMFSQSSSLFWPFSPTTWVTNIIYTAVTGTNWVKITYNFGIYSFYYPIFLQPDFWISLALLLGFVFLVFYLGIKLSDRLFRFEISVSEVTAIKEERWFFSAVRRAIPSPLGAITAVQLKEFTRSLDSIARISSVLMFPLIIYFFNFLGFSNSFLPTSNLFGVLAVPGFAGFYIVLTAAVIAMMEASQMTVKQRDLFWTYKKAPGGVERLVYSKFLEMLIVGLPLSVIIAVFFQFAIGSSSTGILVLIPVMLFFTTISSAIALGIYCARPVFKEQSSGHLINFLIFFVTAFIIQGIMLLFAVFPWILNLISFIPALSVVFSIPTQPATWLIQIPLVITSLAQYGIYSNPMPVILGIVASATLGIVAAYLAIRIGISKLKKFE
ncbi:MAG: hypothetical protein ACUVXA_12045 [Candidatus Jordarchaeum sp.]|uniref:hypothetical protein n=1 Tax=Candidatus Jordarchaeum sp. TaxID=2823881 RepID=UPI00404969B9